MVSFPPWFTFTFLLRKFHHIAKQPTSLYVESSSSRLRSITSISVPNLRKNSETNLVIVSSHQNYEMTHLPVKLVSYSVVFGPFGWSHCFLYSYRALCFLKKKNEISRVTKWKSQGKTLHSHCGDNTISEFETNSKRKKIAQNELDNVKRLNRFLFQTYWWSGDCLCFSRFHSSHCPPLKLQPPHAWCIHRTEDMIST